MKKLNLRGLRQNNVKHIKNSKYGLMYEKQVYPKFEPRLISLSPKTKPKVFGQKFITIII